MLASWPGRCLFAGVVIYLITGDWRSGRVTGELHLSHLEPDDTVVRGGVQMNYTKYSLN